MVTEVAVDPMPRLWSFDVNSATSEPNSTQLALDRTRMAQERTLMAWIRTATSMISFGFTIYKFFQFEIGHQAKPRQELLTPRDFALIMISIGLVSLLLATIQHRKAMREITPYLKTLPPSLAGVVTGFVFVFGILVLLATIFRS